MPLNNAYSDKIVQKDGSTYQLTFRFPTSDSLWEKLKEETFLTADDLHGEQDFVIFEVEKKNGYIQVYANQVFTLLSNYVVNPISLDRRTGSTALSRFAGSITRNNPFSFFSDIEDRHTFNIGSKNAMEAFAKDKHSIIGQWGGDLVRHGYQVRLLKNGGSENESLFMYKKNLSSYQHKTSTKSLKTRITFKTTVKGEGENAPDRKFSVVVDSPLINKYSQIYEDVIEVNDQDVKDEVSLRKYGEQYFKTSLCDMMEDSLELEVVGQSDVSVQIFDIVSLFHEVYNLDVRKKITKYTYSPMAKKLISIGFGQFKSGLANAIGNAVSDAVKGEAQQLQDDFERQLARELKNADLAFDRQKEELVNQFTDGLNAAKAKAEEVKRELSDTIDQRFNSFNNGPLQEVKRRTEEALKNSGASSLLAQEAKRIGLDSVARLEAFKSQATSAQTALSGELDSLKRTIANDIRPKQAQAEAEIAKQVEALIQTKKELAGVKSAQATYEETTTRRLSELTNLANGKASKSELTQTAEQLASKIASVQAGSSRNYFRNSRSRTFTTGDQATYDYRTFIVPDFWKNSDRFKRDYVRISFDMTFPVALANDMPAMVHFSAHPWYAYRNLVFKGGTTERQHFEFTIDLSSSSETYQTNNVFIRFGTNYGFPAGLQVVIENAMLSVGNYFPAYQPAYEDQEDRVSIVESNFKQRADALDAGVSRLTEGLRTKADISALNVTAENIRQSVKSFETSTQDKLNQMLSLAEFEVRAGSIRQEILNATKDKADKTLVIAEAGKIREEFSSLRVGGTNLLKGSKGPFMPDRKPANFDNNVLYAGQTSIYMEQGQEYIISAKTDGKFTAHHDGNKESDNVVLWIMDKNVRNYQIVSDLKTGTTGTKFVWNKPTGIYHLRVNTYHKEAVKSVWDVKIEKGNIATDWSPAIEDTDGLITEAKATFERTAQGLRTDLSAIQEYVNKDSQRQEALQRYTREESAKQATAVRELVAREYVGKSTYQEDVRGLERRFNAISTQTNNDITSKIAQYKQTVDGQFANITSQIAGKASQTDFQRVKETSQLYERILGSTDNGIANNIARMAMTSQLFQVEVSKAFGNHQNLFLNSTSTKGYLGNAGIIYVANSIQKEITSDFISVEPNENIIFQHWVTLPDNGMAWTAWQFFDKNKNPIDVRRIGLNSYKATTGKQHNINQITVLANAYFVRFSARMYDDGLIKVEQGSIPSDYSVAPNDALEAVKTVQTQLAGSWGVHNKNSVNEIIAGFNLAGRNAGIKAETIRLEGRTLLDELTAIQGYFKRLFVGEGTFATLNTDILRANSITADKLVFNEALANRMVSNEIITSKLVASRAFVNALNAVTIDASQIVTGTLKGDRIYGGTIRGTNIYGGTLTGHTQIQLGSYGSFDAVNGGLQINVPRDYNAKDGLGVQFIGSYGRGENVPYGLFLYRDSDFTIGNTATDTDEFLMTVQGYINAKGIGWMKTGKGSVNGKTTATIGLWNSENVSLDFGGSGNDIYYSYNGTAYSLWSVVNQHFSDRRLKENIVDCKHKALDYIHQFQFKEYDWKKQEDRPQQAHTKIGLIAQEVQEVDPTLVYENGDTLNLDNLRLTNIALKAIQELSQRIETLERKLS
jgi:phage minor structural protein